MQKQKQQEEAAQKAERLTKEAAEETASYENILKATLKVNDAVNWKDLKDTTPFAAYVPNPNPKPTLEQFLGRIFRYGFLEIIPYFKDHRLQAEKEAKRGFNRALRKYEKEEKSRLGKYSKEKGAFLKKQDDYNKAIESKKTAYGSLSKQGVVDYFNLVLERSIYPDSLSLFPQVSYEEHSKLALIDMELPNPEQMPKVKEYRYVKTKDAIDDKELGVKEFESFYNNTLLRIALRTIHEVFESDYKQAVETVVFNGWVGGIDPKTGHDFKNCIVSLQVGREEFESINLAKINPRECFRHLKGVSAGSFVNLAPVKPIMLLNTEDGRIVEAGNVLEGFDDNTNLATIEWQEFEILVRDLFQKEFSHEGCKVEVTRASRDAGVDGIAFDDDPIRGGKYVLQAKRYNNLVPLSAVRDLYGTVHNEGAVKGILITTSYYGKDALEFAKDKPLKLINGEELLYMFNKHGYKFKIELTKKQKAASSVPY